MHISSLTPISLLLTASLIQHAAALNIQAADAAKKPAARHVILFGIDGLSPDGVMKSDTPNMHRLMKEGAFTMHARAVLPTSSSPNWASMLMGAGPEQHGITSNDWETNKFEIVPLITGPGGMFPTIFSVIREQHPQAVTASFYDWDGTGRLTERSLISMEGDCDGPTNTVERAIGLIQTSNPEFLFLQLDHVDHAGHAHGHGTAEYYAAAAVADKLLGRLLDAIGKEALESSTTVIVASDHGGVNKGHGKATMAEIEIPWIVAGPGIAKGREIRRPVMIYDTAATIARILQLKTPEAWIARPVNEIFASTPLQ